MEELKTLKDLEVWFTKFGDEFDDLKTAPTQEMINRIELRAEAVKWVKEGLSEKKNSGVINWIKHFFNLTEEDLK